MLINKDKNNLEILDYQQSKDLSLLPSEKNSSLYYNFGFGKIIGFALLGLTIFIILGSKSMNNLDFSKILSRRALSYDEIFVNGETPLTKKDSKLNFDNIPVNATPNDFLSLTHNNYKLWKLNNAIENFRDNYKRVQESNDIPSVLKEKLYNLDVKDVLRFVEDKKRLHTNFLTAKDGNSKVTTLSITSQRIQTIRDVENAGKELHIHTTNAFKFIPKIKEVTAIYANAGLPSAEFNEKYKLLEDAINKVENVRDELSDNLQIKSNRSNNAISYSAIKDTREYLHLDELFDYASKFDYLRNKLIDDILEDTECRFTKINAMQIAKCEKLTEKAIFFNQILSAAYESFDRLQYALESYKEAEYKWSQASLEMLESEALVYNKHLQKEKRISESEIIWKTKLKGPKTLPDNISLNEFKKLIDDEVSEINKAAEETEWKAKVISILAKHQRNFVENNELLQKKSQEFIQLNSKDLLSVDDLNQAKMIVENVENNTSLSFSDLDSLSNIDYSISPEEFVENFLKDSHIHDCREDASTLEKIIDTAENSKQEEISQEEQINLNNELLNHNLDTDEAKNSDFVSYNEHF